MTNLFVSTHAVRITDETGEWWVDIKPQLTLADRGRYTDAIMGVGADLEGRGATMDFHRGKVTLTLLECAIVAWNWLDPDTEKVLKVTPNNIGRINWEHPFPKKVLESIQERNPTLSDLSASSGSES